MRSAVIAAGLLVAFDLIGGFATIYLTPYVQNIVNPEHQFAVMACANFTSISGMGIGGSGRGNGIPYGYPDCVYGAMYAKNESQFWVDWSSSMVLCNGNPFLFNRTTLVPLFPDCISIRHDHRLKVNGSYGIDVSATVMWQNSTMAITCGDFKPTTFGGIWVGCVGGTFLVVSANPVTNYGIRVRMV